MAVTRQVWQAPGQHWPTTGQEVWVRVANTALPPFRAKFDSDRLTFTPVTIQENPDPLTGVPWYLVTAWRSL